MGRPLGANPINDFIMKTNYPSRGNSVPKGKGGGSWIPSSKDAGKRANSAARKRSASNRSRKSFVEENSSFGNRKRSASSRGYKSFTETDSSFGNRKRSASSRGYKSFTETDSSFSKNKRSVSNRSFKQSPTTPQAKVLGGAAIAKAGTTYTQAFAKYGPLGLGVLLFFDILLADQGLASTELPEHIRNVGEKEIVQFPSEPPFKGGQESGVYYKLRYYSLIAVGNNNYGELYRNNDERIYTHSVNLPGPVTGYTLHYPNGNETSFGEYKTRGKQFTQGYFLSIKGQDDMTLLNISFRNSWGIEPIDFVRADGRPDTGGDPPPERKGITSQNTTNHSNIPTPKKATVDNPPPPSVKPPFPSDETASPTPSKSFERPTEKPPVVKKATTKIPKGKIESNTSNDSNTSNSNTSNESNISPSTKQLKIKAPSPTPEPLPTPTPTKEKTIQEIEQPEVVETPKIISDTQVRRADGTTQKTVVREATPEEMEEYEANLNRANSRVDSAREVIKEYENWQDLSFSKFNNREPSELDKYKQEFRDKIEANRRSPFGEVDSYKMSPSRFDDTDDWKYPFGRPGEKSKEKQSQKTTNELPIPEPDQSEKDKPQPNSEPVKQTPKVDDPIKNKIDKLPTLDDIAITVAGLDIIKQIAQKAGSASPVCLAPTLHPSLDRNNATTAAAQGAILGQGQVTQTAVNAANSTLNHPSWGLQAIVTNTSYGLQRIQGFAQIAWKATRADKIVNALNTLLIVHNAMMLSNNIASTISEALNLGLEALGIRDEEDKIIDIGGAVRGKLTSILQSWFGEEKYRQLTLRLASANRIYQSGANIVYGLRNVFDAGQYLVENISENVAFIGNALRRDGVVRENSYRLMPTDVNSTSRLLYRLEAANDVVDVIEEIASDAKDITEEIGELRENQKQFEKEFKEVFDDRTTEETDTKNYATSTPEPSEEDELRGVKDGN